MTAPERWRPSWWRRAGTLVLWVALQGVFLLLPPLLGLIVNIGLAVGFVWWFAVRGGPSARHRRSVFRLRAIPPAVAQRLPFVAVPLVSLVATSLVVVPRVIPFPPPRVDPLEAYLRRPGAIATILVLVSVVAPLLEEFLFRGWIQRSLERRLPAAQAIGITALAFAAAHGELFGLPIRLVFGLVAGYAAWSTRSIWPGVILHGLYNGALIGLGSATPGVDEKMLTRWAHTPDVFWPVVAVFLVSALLLVAALGWMAAAVPNASRHTST